MSLVSWNGERYTPDVPIQKEHEGGNASRPDLEDHPARLGYHDERWRKRLVFGSFTNTLNVWRERRGETQFVRRRVNLQTAARTKNEARRPHCDYRRASVFASVPRCSGAESRICEGDANFR
jgi:hypothetical protein